MRKYQVSYLAFGIYIACVLLISLLIALLVSLAGVKRGDCDTASKVKISAAVNDLVGKAEKEALQLNARAKRHADIRQEIRDIAKKSDYITRKLGHAAATSHANKQNPFKANDDCPDFLIYQNGTLWEDVRLPPYIRPTKYDLEFDFEFKNEIYAGRSVITIELDRDTNVVIFHSTSVDILNGGLYDKNNNEIKIKCGGFYPYNDYYVIITENPISKNSAPLQLRMTYIGKLSRSEEGIFDIEYEGGQSSSLITSHFQPLDARKAFPCFDEPSFKSVFSISIDHPTNTIAVSNMPPKSDEPILSLNNTLKTTFQDTPKLPTYLLAITVFNKNDFKVESGVSGSGKKINVWARNKFVDNGFASGPKDLAVDIWNAAEYYLYPLDGLDGTGPDVINMIALPDYHDDAVAHWGIPLFRETKLLYKSSTVTELVKQRIALLIGKTFAEFWAGNAVTFKWWDELYLQEGLSDYLKYKFVDFAYQEWRVNEQFITEELINVLVDDAYPSSHPVVKPVFFFYDIEQLFDDVETAKVASILRMIENEIGDAQMWRALGNYFKQFIGGTADPNYLFQQFGNIRKWPAKDFIDRWFLQSNYPVLFVRLTYDSVARRQVLEVIQDRNLNSEESIFGLDELYPSPFNFTWYVPLKCAFGESVDDQQLNYFTFDVDQKSQKFNLDKNYTWLHCDEDFIGYYMLDYTRDNWNKLAQVLYNQDTIFQPPDRANIIHNAFVNAYAERERYTDLVNILNYLRNEDDFLPWRTVSKHLHDLVDVLQYRPSFYSISNYFNFELRFIERNIDLWTPSNNHVEQILKSTILDLACRLQDFDCLRNTSTYWDVISNSFGNPESNTVPIHVRPIVYNYHFQNTYSLRDWDLAFIQYEATQDPQEEERLLEALTFTRLPSQLARFLESQRSGGLKAIDFVDAVRFFAVNPLGRELVWNYYRSNYEGLVDEYSLDSPILGQLLIEIVQTFEDEFLFFELIKFIIYTPSGASMNARFKALEIVSTTVVWLIDKEEEIEAAFSPRTATTKLSIDSKFEKAEFLNKVKEFTQMKEFQEFRSKLKTNTRQI